MRRAPWWLLCLLVPVCASALGAATQPIPSALQDWQAWVLHGHEQRTCPLLSTQSGTDDNAYQCAWPGRLQLTLDKAGARFRLDVHVDAESWIDLPGGRDAWPQQVRLDNAPAVVLDHGGTPALRLAAGDYMVRGEFAWDERPARLQVPAAIALVDLDVDGARIAQPERDGGWLVLGKAAVQQRQADALSVRVFRRLADGAPPMLDTRIQLHVAGSAREQLLGPALPHGFVATALDGDLPVRLDPDGRLQVQLRPGDWTLMLNARGTAPLGKLQFQAPQPPWPGQEIWSYADAPALRTTRATGAQPIDPAQARVPDQWHGLPAFVMGRGATLAVEQRARGRDSNADDHLKLARELWLDFDGHGLTAEDRLTGSLRSKDRLDVAAPWTLEHAGSSADGTQPLLVTRGGSPAFSGVEVRARNLDLQAGLRRDSRGGAQSATGGWQQTLDGVEMGVHLPYGYRLLGAPGADRSPDSWVAQWNLLDLFVAAVIALLAWRLLGWQWGLVALAFVVLSQGEPGAPRWTAGLAVALALVARALPAGKLRAFARWAGMAMLALAVLATLPFGAEQVRTALHPQLEHSGYLARIVGDRFASTEASKASKPGFREARTEFIPPPPASPVAAPAKVMGAPAPLPPPPPADMTLQSIVVSGSRIPAIDSVAGQGYPSDLVVQSGRGVPAWGDIGNTYRLGWSGPVTPDGHWRLVILPAWATRILRIVMLGLLLVWLAAIARSFDLPVRIPRWPPRAGTGGALLLLLALIAPHVRAQSMPSPELLSQLRARLLEAPACAPRCAASPMAQVAIQKDGAQVSLAVTAGSRVAVPLPWMDAPSRLDGVAVDGKPTTDLVRRDGHTWVKLERGVHRVALDFHVGDADAVALHFPLAPPRVQVSAPGWQASGTDGTRLLSDTLTFARERVQATATSAPGVARQAFPPYVALTRSIALGLDSRVDNTVTRISPAEGGFTVGLPLLPGEHVSDAGLKVRDGRVQITFASGQDEARWSSTLDATSALALQAPSFDERAETWRIAAAPLLHPAFTGVPEASDDGGPDGVHVFLPLPGESLRVAVTRPQALQGASVAFDRVSLDASRGERALESTLTLVARSTRGGEHTIDLPPKAQLIGAQRDGQAIELNPRDGHVALPLRPGVQTFKLRFRGASDLGMLAGTPAAALHAGSANIDLSLALPQDRWVLWAWGPPVGPAVLVWAQLVVLLIVAIALARFAPTPLRWWQWLLLGVGFSTFAWSAFALVAVWLIVLGLRARSKRPLAWQAVPFNLMQIGLAFLTLVALLCLISVVPQGLLGQPDMRVAGNGSTAWSLHWFHDQSTGVLPQAGAFSLPLWAYK
ncbi:MAG TPA: hypothetical protein VFY97_00400, partial [Rhodanobacteraceae bacterium]|nr:hypothetical protein [Rhodanobacteraceae bacterium]